MRAAAPQKPPPVTSWSCSVEMVASCDMVLSLRLRWLRWLSRCGRRRAARLRTAGGPVVNGATGFVRADRGEAAIDLPPRPLRAAPDRVEPAAAGHVVELGVRDRLKL